MAKGLMLCLAGAVVAFLSATSAQARSYDCAEADHAPEGAWQPEQSQTEEAYAELNKQKGWGDFMYRACGTIENGQQVFLVGALHVVDGFAICDDDANYAMFYDPKTKTFSTPIAHQKLCGHGQKIPRPQQ